MAENEAADASTTAGRFVLTRQFLFPGASAREAARRLGVPTSTYQKWEADGYKFSDRNRKRYSDGLARRGVDSPERWCKWIETGDGEAPWTSPGAAPLLHAGSNRPAMPIDTKQLVGLVVALNEAAAKIKLAMNNTTPQLVREALEEASMCVGIAKRKAESLDQSGLAVSSGSVLLKYTPIRLNRCTA